MTTLHLLGRPEARLFNHLNITLYIDVVVISKVLVTPYHRGENENDNDNERAALDNLDDLLERLRVEMTHVVNSYPESCLEARSRRLELKCQRFL